MLHPINYGTTGLPDDASGRRERRDTATDRGRRDNSPAEVAMVRV